MLGVGLSTAPKAPRASKCLKVQPKRNRSSGEKGTSTSKRGKTETSSVNLPDADVEGRRTPGIDEDDEDARLDPTLDCEIVVIHAGTRVALACMCALPGGARHTGPCSERCD